MTYGFHPQQRSVRQYCRVSTTFNDLILSGPSGVLRELRSRRDTPDPVSQAVDAGQRTDLLLVPEIRLTILSNKYCLRHIHLNDAGSLCPHGLTHHNQALPAVRDPALSQRLYQPIRHVYQPATAIPLPSNPSFTSTAPAHPHRQPHPYKIISQDQPISHPYQRHSNTMAPTTSKTTDTSTTNDTNNTPPTPPSNLEFRPINCWKCNMDYYTTSAFLAHIQLCPFLQLQGLHNRLRQATDIKWVGIRGQVGGADGRLGAPHAKGVHKRKDAKKRLGRLREVYIVNYFRFGGGGAGGNGMERRGAVDLGGASLCGEWFVCGTCGRVYLEKWKVWVCEAMHEFERKVKEKRGKGKVFRSCRSEA